MEAMTLSLRHSHEFKDYTLDKLYGVLRTYELEIQQDEEIEKGQRKDKSIALLHKMKKKCRANLTKPFLQNKCMRKGRIKQGKVKDGRS